MYRRPAIDAEWDIQNGKAADIAARGGKQVHLSS